VSTGMRMGAITGLQIGHLNKIPQYHLYKIIVYAASRKNRYYTFCTPECASAIDSYLAYRKRFGDPLKPTAPLIREQFDIEDRFAGQYPKPLAHRTIEFTISTILKRSGVKTKEVARSHGFRKFAITQMIKAKLDYTTREYLVGHRISRGLGVNYDRTTEEDRLQEYLKAVDLLTINSENRLKRKIYQLESQHSDEWNALKR
ncbi:MAG: site-specific integrase, partial [Nitrososphaeraceae archaeon]